MHNPPHPGLVLCEYLAEMSLSAAAEKLCATQVALSRVLTGKARVSAGMARRLAAALNTSSELWMNMQSQYEFWHANNG